jgi:O-antigen/teichoic acid export membrane protein
MASVRTALAYSLLSSNFSFLLQFVGTLLIARLLSPAELGVFSVASVGVGLAHVLRDLGASSYIIQAKELSAALLRSVFGLSVTMGVCIAAAVFFASWPVARFYNSDELIGVMQILALNFLLTPLGSVTLACVRRDMRFREVGINRVLSASTSMVASCVLAWRGLGAEALAWGAVVGTATTAVHAQWLRPSYLPFGISFRGWVQVLGFGALSTSANMIGHLNLAAADLLLGKLAGMAPLGYFNRAGTLGRFFFNLVMQGLGPVLLPALAQKHREGGDLSQAIVRISTQFTAVAWPALSVIAVLAAPLMQVMFGPQWGASVPLVPYFCGTLAISSAFVACSSLHTARGKPQINVVLEALNLALKAIAIVLTAPHGLIHVAMAWPAVAACGAIAHHIALKREVGLGPVIFWRPMVVNFGLAVACGVAAMVGQLLVQTAMPASSTLGDLVTVSLASGCAFVAWLMLVVVLRLPMLDELRRLRDAVVSRVRRRAE